MCRVARASSRVACLTIAQHVRSIGQVWVTLGGDFQLDVSDGGARVAPKSCQHGSVCKRTLHTRPCCGVDWKRAFGKRSHCSEGPPAMFRHLVFLFCLIHLTVCCGAQGCVDRCIMGHGSKQPCMPLW